MYLHVILQKLRTIRDIPWIGNKPPVDEPYCGYHGEKCYCNYIHTHIIYIYILF
jgi:hypothetical protein